MFTQKQNKLLTKNICINTTKFNRYQNQFQYLMKNRIETADQLSPQQILTSPCGYDMLAWVIRNRRVNSAPETARDAQAERPRDEGKRRTLIYEKTFKTDSSLIGGLYACRNAPPGGAGGGGGRLF